MSKIKEIDTGKVKLLAVKVPEKSKGHSCMFDRLFFQVEGVGSVKVDLPSDCKLLGLSGNITEEQWKDLIPQQDGCHYFDYILFRGHLQNYVDTAKESGLSLLEANQITEPVLILKLIRENE